MMAQIKVTRKSYVRKNGTVVKETSYYTKDKGKLGKTPASEKWYKHNLEIHWHKDEPAEVRRANALKAHNGNKLTAARALQALANVTTDSKTSELAKIDADYHSTSLNVTILLHINGIVKETIKGRSIGRLEFIKNNMCLSREGFKLFDLSCPVVNANFALSLASLRKFLKSYCATNI
jgi:hypothetical protein